MGGGQNVVNLAQSALNETLAGNTESWVSFVEDLESTDLPRSDEAYRAYLTELARE